MAIGDVFSLVKTTSIPNAPTARLLHFLLPAGVIDGVRVKLEGATASDDIVFNFAVDGVAVTTTELTLLDTTDEIEATGLAETVTNDQWGTISIDNPFTSGSLDGVTAIGVHVTYVTQTVNLTGAQTVAGVKTFSSDPIIPDEAYGVGWNGSLEPPTKNAVYDKIETLGGGTVDTANTPNANEYARFTDSDTIEGRTEAEFKADMNLEIGTDVQAWDTLLDLIAALADPGADKILFWDESANAFAWLEPAANLSITNTDLDAAGGAGSVASDAIFDAKGDLAVGTGADTADNLTVGANDTMLMAASGETTGLKWATPTEVRTATGLATGDSPQFAAINLGHASDTTLSRDAAGSLAIEGVKVATVGKQTIYIPASAMIAATTSGPASAQQESATNDINYQTLAFDATADEHAHFNVAFPKSWNLGTVTFQVFWSSSATDTDGVAWGLQSIAISDNEAIDAAWGTPVVVTDDAQSAANELYVTAESSAVTIGGTPADDDLVYFRIFRDVSDANDDMTEDALLIGVKIFYTTDAATDA